MMRPFQLMIMNEDGTQEVLDEHGDAVWITLDDDHGASNMHKRVAKGHVIDALLLTLEQHREAN